MSSSKYSRIFKIGSTTIVISTISWIIFQAKTTKRILENAVDLSILNQLEEETSKKYEEINMTSEYIDLESFKSTKKTWKFWESLKFLVAQRLIGLCHNETSEFIRTKALISLGKINLNPSHLTIISNMIDQKTSVRLARVKDVNLKLFKEPPVKYLKYDDDMLINEMKELLSNLLEMSKHTCLQYFVSKAFFDIDSDNETAHIETAKLGQSNGFNLLPVCLESLRHHASIENFSKDVAKLNALPLLSEIHARFRDDVDVNIALCQIISYLSFYPDVLEELHKTGWLRILAEWMNHSNIRISVPAAKTLANLEGNQEIYRRHLFLLHPNFIGNKDSKVDVVFVHGLLGGIFFTWRQRTEKSPSTGLLGKGSTSNSSSNISSQKKESISQTFQISDNERSNSMLKSSEPHTMQYIKDYEEDCLNEVRDFEIVLDDIPIAGNGTSNYGYTCDASKFELNRNDDSFTFCWPRDWLSEDCDGLRIIGVNYDTTLSQWNSFCPYISGRTHIEEQSLKLMANLLEAGVGKRPVIFVTHSMGGLLVKNILGKAFYSSDPQVRNLLENTRGIVFYSTPHLGSNLANFNPASQLMLRLSIEVQDLREKSPLLIDIHEKFLQVLQKNPIKIITFVETKKTVFTAFKFNFQLVTPESANIGIGEYYEIPLDHLGICKPMSKCSFLYRKTLEFIREIVEESNDQK